MERLYCTLSEIIDDLDLAGVKAWREDVVLDKVRSASDYIDRHFGYFIPVTATKRFDGYGGIDLWVGNLLDVTSITDDEESLLTTDYLLYPRERLWANGPYSRITLDPDATTIGVWSREDDIIQVVGQWGLYNKSAATGATVSSQDASSTALAVDDGSPIGLGAVLLIDDEQELVSGRGAATASSATLNGALDASSEQVAVSDGTQVNAGEIIKVDFEQMMVLDISGNNLLVVRGWNRTTKTTHLDTTAVNVYRTFTVQRAVNGTTAATHSSADISRYEPPEIVNYLCRQMATLMMKKAEGGYAGKTGNVELGEVFYMDEFPNAVLKEVKSTFIIPVV